MSSSATAPVPMRGSRATASARRAMRWEIDSELTLDGSSRLDARRG